jgi:hypothetical protein
LSELGDTFTFRGSAVQPKQPAQNINLDNADHGLALIATQLDVVALDNRDDAAAAIDAAAFSLLALNWKR